MGRATKPKNLLEALKSANRLSASRNFGAEPVKSKLQGATVLKYFKTRLI